MKAASDPSLFLLVEPAYVQAFEGWICSHRPRRRAELLRDLWWQMATHLEVDTGRVTLSLGELREAVRADWRELNLLLHRFGDVSVLRVRGDDLFVNPVLAWSGSTEARLVAQRSWSDPFFVEE